MIRPLKYFRYSACTPFIALYGSRGENFTVFKYRRSPAIASRPFPGLLSRAPQGYFTFKTMPVVAWIMNS